MSGHVQPPVAPQPGSGMIVAVVVPVLAFLILIPALLYLSWYCNTPEIIWKNCKRKTTKKKKKT
uniref:Uncharacterized protein n=1 Tax=Panagrolaimus sp. JU765 TaxID=591449 RepID=A0AC34RDV1_9BILA